MFTLFGATIVMLAIGEGLVRKITENMKEAICKYASDPANGVWIDNVHDIAAYVKERRGEPVY